MKVDLYSEKGIKLAAKAELPEGVFGIKPNDAVLRQYIHVYQTNQRLGTVATKTRGEVSGGGRKPWRQKGTGRARHGSTRSPIWIKGGVAHGPKPRVFSLAIPKKTAQLALKSALSIKASEGKVKVFQKLDFEKPQTARAAELLEKLGISGRVLVVIPGYDKNLYRSFRNIQGVEVRAAQELNAYDVVLAEGMVLLEEAIKKIRERLTGVLDDQVLSEASQPRAGFEELRKKKKERKLGARKKRAAKPEPKDAGEETPKQVSKGKSKKQAVKKRTIRKVEGSQSSA